MIDRKKPYEQLNEKYGERKEGTINIYDFQAYTENVESKDENLASYDVNEYFRNKQIEIVETTISKRYDGKLKFSDNKLIILNELKTNIISYKLKAKVLSTVKTKEEIKKIYCYEDLIFISFFNSFQIRNIAKNKNIYEHNSIKNFYSGEVSGKMHYSMNTDNEFITDKTFYVLEYKIVLSAFYCNYKLLYAIKMINIF